MRQTLLAVAAFSLAAPALAATSATDSPLAFFEGRTVSEGTTKIIMKKPLKARSQGIGRIEPDGTLLLVQQVDDEGEPRKERRWRIRQVAPNRFVGTMNEAVGPVTVDQIGARFHFRFKMKAGLAVEQWLTPLADGNSARSTIKVRKFGIAVASGDAIIRRVAPKSSRASAAAE